NKPAQIINHLRIDNLYGDTSSVSIVEVKDSHKSVVVTNPEGHEFLLEVASLNDVCRFCINILNSPVLKELPKDTYVHPFGEKPLNFIHVKRGKSRVYKASMNLSINTAKKEVVLENSGRNIKLLFSERDLLVLKDSI